MYAFVRACVRAYVFLRVTFCLCGVLLFLATSMCTRAHSPRGDMDENWHQLGIKGCTTCLVRKRDMADVECLAPARSFAAARLAVTKARAEKMLGRGHQTSAKGILKSAGLLPIHFILRNPFLELPHADYECFPMCRLHGLYVSRVFAM